MAAADNESSAPDKTQQDGVEDAIGGGVEDTGVSGGVEDAVGGGNATTWRTRAATAWRTRKAVAAWRTRKATAHYLIRHMFMPFSFSVDFLP